jgi:hypothetical protein
MKTEINNAHDLKAEVSAWVDTFNYVQLEVLEKMADNMLFEYIRMPEPDYEEFLNNYNLWDEYKEWLEDNEYEDFDENRKEFCEDHSSFDRFLDEQNDRNYPMWNTCFEFKQQEYEDVISAAIACGFGVIEGLDPFNTMLFVSGCGYSFYGAHWIPLFLELPWNSNIKKRVAELNIKYDNL